MNLQPQPAEDGSVLRHELERLQKEWWWFLLLGIGLAVLGIVAMGSSYFVSVVTTVMFGFLLLVGGVGQIVSSFWAGRWSGFLMHLLIGIFYVIGGFLIIDAPEQGAAAITLLVATLLMVSGIFRIIGAMTLKFHDWGWVVLNGIVTLLLGLLIYRQWPASGEWVIGLFIGIEMFLNGLSWFMFALNLRIVPTGNEPR